MFTTRGRTPGLLRLGRLTAIFNLALFALIVAGVLGCAVTWGVLLLSPRGREAVADVRRTLRLLLSKTKS